MENYTESQDSNKVDETQNVSVNESQDFHLVVTDSDDFLNKSENNIEKTKPEETGLDNDQKPVIESNLQDSFDILEFKRDDNINIKTKKDTENEKAIKKEYKVIEDNVYSDVHEHKDEFPDNDEDEVIQGTPPHLYSSPRPKKAIIATDVMTLKRKVGFSDERPAKIVKISIEPTLNINERFVKEGNHQLSCKSGDFYEELSKNSPKNIIIEETQDLQVNELSENSGRNIIIEETQDLQVNEFSQDSSNNLAKDAGAIENSAIRERSFEQQNKVFLEKSCDMNENENSNISMKVIESSTNDSIITINSLHESNIQIEGNNLSMETKENVAFKDENNKIQTNTTENKEITGNNSKYHEQEISSQMKTYDEDCSKNTGSCKARMSIEVIYDQTNKTAMCESKSKPELVEIDEEGEKIILDSLDEDPELKDLKPIKDSFDSKSDNKLRTGSSQSTKNDTISVESDIFSNIDLSSALERGNNNPTDSIHIIKGSSMKGNSFVSKDLDNIDFISISDNENDISNVEDNIKNKSDLIHSSVLAKAMQIEKEVGVYVKLKCLLHIDENTKEILSKELTAVHCESNIEMFSRQKNEDTSSSLADVSDNSKETSPGSVNSNPQLYHLNPRLSVSTSISTSSSASSAASLAAKLALKDSMHFSLPRGPVKHARKLVQDTTLINDKQTDEKYHRLINEWKNNDLFTTTLYTPLLNCVNAELSAIDTYNINNEKLYDQHLQKVCSSTPEVLAKKKKLITPKNTKKGKTLKRIRSKITKLNVQNNTAENVNIPQILVSTHNDITPSKIKSKIETEESKLLVNNMNILTNSSPRDELIGESINKDVFAKWSDNNYYPGVIADKIKTKYRINFYDGKSKVLIPEFIIPIPKTLKEGLSVYASTKVDDYGSCGIIVDIQTATNNIYYIVETDEGERLRVQIKNIFLSSDQAQVLKEEINFEAFPITPKHLGQVTLDNMIEGKRRSKRIGTPVSSMPKSSTKSSNLEPSVSGVPVKLKKKRNTLSENEGISSDSAISVKDENINGVQSEIIGTPYEQIAKGPQSKIKGKPRSKRKVEDEETIIRLGPIPEANSNIFKGMSFILACVSPDTLDKYQNPVPVAEIETDNETENEEVIWTKSPFVRDRLRTQIIEGGGKVYTDFDDIPKDEYQNTKLITNVPNTTAKSILCLSVGIRAYNHKWIIRCCLEGKIVNPVENILPTGWSLQKQSYLDEFEKVIGEPLMQTLIIIPSTAFDREFTTFWRKVCENAGAIVLEVENAGIMETLDFDNDIKTVIVSNRKCPYWAVKESTKLKIPLLSTTWVTQCLIEGKRCDEEQHPRYKYNYI